MLDAALVLLADHELAASTVAARVAASVRADPYAVASAGLAVVSGTLHGGASLGIEALLDEIDRPDQAATVIGGRLRRGERLRGFHAEGDGQQDGDRADHKGGDSRHPHFFARPPLAPVMDHVREKIVGEARAGTDR